MIGNFNAGLAFCWRVGFDNPQDGVHTTLGDPGGATFGGVTQATWTNAVDTGIVKGELAKASIHDLSEVLGVKFWGETCDALPAGLDLLVFNGRMMTGAYPKLLQQCLGFMGNDEVDGWIGPVTLGAVRASHARTLIRALSGSHHAYLMRLAGWVEFGGGWNTRVRAALAAAIALADGVVS